MENIALSPLEKEMANFNFDELTAKTTAAKAVIANTESVGDVKAEVCKIWGIVGKFIKPLEFLPIAGQYIKILADFLDSFCAA